MQQRDHLDAAIDRVARAMTEGVPSEALRETVARRTTGTASGSWRPWSMAAVAAALIVMAVAVWRERPMEAPPGGVGARHSAAAQPTVASAVQSDEARRAAVGNTISVTSGSSPRGRTAARQTVTAATSDAVLISPLAIDPIGSAGVQVETMVVPTRVAIDPIAVAPMRIRELGQPAE